VRTFRIFWRAGATLLATFGSVALPLLGRLVLVGHPRAIARLGAWSTSLWGRTMCAILGVERDVRGAIPKDGVFLVAANHLSYLDILVLGSLYPSLFVAKDEIATWPVFGWVARAAGTLFIDRNDARDVVRAGREMSEHLALGVALTIFPEGRATSGAEVLPFLPSLLEPAAKAGVPCWAASLTYETPGSTFSPATTICWYDRSSFPAHFVRLSGLKRIVARVHFAPAPVSSSSRKELAKALQERVSLHFEPIPQEVNP
jgi:1-acyl-sn-glycerol-3-phosphate acyltransferase